MLDAISKGSEFALLFLLLFFNLSSWAYSSWLRRNVIKVYDPPWIIELAVTEISFTELFSSVGVYFHTVVDSETWSQDRSQKLSIIWGPFKQRSWVRLAISNFLLSCQIPDLNFSIEISKACDSYEPSLVSPNYFVSMMFSKVHYLFIVLCKEAGLGWHESADHNESLSFEIPSEIVKRSIGNFYLVDLFGSVVVEIKAVFSIVGFSSRVIVRLKLH